MVFKAAMPTRRVMLRAAVWFLVLLFLSLGGCVEGDASIIMEVEGSDGVGSGSNEGSGWPPLAEATIRPGVNIVYTVRLVPGAEGACTSNFLFRSPDNQTLYLGTAAHCVTPNDVNVGTGSYCPPDEAFALGSPIKIEGASQPGTLVYSSWDTMRRINETNEDACYGNDFALVQIDEEDRASVHPAMLHYGGPTGLANSTEIQVNSRVFVVGKSAYHWDLDPLVAREGYVSATDMWGGWGFLAYLASPAVPGDSGGCGLDAEGKAAGVLVSGHFGTPTPGSAGFIVLDRALEYANEHSDLEVELVTWEPLDDGVLPDL